MSNISKKLKECKTIENVKAINSEISDALDYFDIKYFNKVYVVEDINDYYDVLKHHRINNKNTFAKSTKFVFRGISEPNQKYSKLTRLFIDNPSLTQEELTFIEVDMLRKFEQNSAYLLNALNSPIDLVATAQHYSLSTRLLDWSFSPLVATLFALYEKKYTNKENNEIPYYAICATRLQDHVFLENLLLEKNSINESKTIMYLNMVRQLEEIFKKNDIEEYKNYLNKAFSSGNVNFVLKTGLKQQDLIISNAAKKLNEGKILFLKSSFSNTRIVEQKGLFQITLHTNNREYLNRQYANSNVILLSKNLRPDLISLCEYFGVNYYGLTPDVEHIAKEIGRREKEKWK